MSSAEDDAQGSVRELARDVAHEINNVLTAVLGLAERLESEPGLEASVREQIGLIAGHGRRLRRFSQDLSAFARGEAPAPRSARVAAAPATSQIPAKAPVRTEPVADPSRLILVVDDEEVVRKILSWQLQGMGYQVLAVDSAESALSLYDAEPERVGLALLDLVLGGKSGLHLANELRQRRPALPVIMLTGIDQHPAQAGSTDPWLIKPVPLQDLRNAVERALAQA